MIAYAFKDDAVIACILQFWPEMSAGIGSAYGSGKRRFCHDLKTAAAGCRGSGKRACHKYQFVVRSKRVCLRIHLITEIFRSQPSCAYEILCRLHIQRLFCYTAVR